MASSATRWTTARSFASSIRIDRARREATIDFTGTSAQQPNNFNAPLPVTRAAVLYVFRTLVDDEIPMNAGCMKPLHLIVPEGSMLAPRYPAAVVAGNVETSQVVTDCLYGALGVLAASQGTMNNFTFGNDEHQYYETISGGSGAGPDFDGTDAVQTHMTNSRLTDPEVLEWRFPVRLESFRIRRGSGGAGPHRGGDGVERRLRFLEPMTAVMLANHRRVAPFGMAGGEPAATGRNWIERASGGTEQFDAAFSTRRAARRRHRHPDARRRRIRQEVSDAPNMKAPGLRQHRGHRARVLRLRGLQHARGAGVQQAVLPDFRSARRARCWLSPPTGWATCRGRSAESCSGISAIAADAASCW